MTTTWHTQRLAEVAQRITDGSHNPPKGVSKSEFLMLSSKNVFDDNLHYEDPRYLSSEQFHREDKRTRIGPGDVLLTIVGTIGRCAVVPADAPKITAQRSIAVIRVDSTAIEPRFLMYSLIHRRDKLNDQARGVAQKGIYLETLRELEVESPPLSEQQRIVANLDEAFAAIAAARANTEQNLRNASELVETAAESLFMTGRESGAEGRSLEDLCDLIVDCEHKTAPTQAQGIPSIRTPNIGRGRLVLDGVYRVSEETYREWTRRAEPKAGDLILAREAPAGNVAVVPEGLRVCLGQRTVLIRPNRSVFEPAYLAHLLLLRDSQERLLAHSRGATVLHVNVKDIKAFRLSAVPPLEVQRAVIEKIDCLLQQGDVLMAVLRQKLSSLDDLKQSLLHQAFSGAL